MKKFRVIIWGPGVMGGGILRAALQRDDMEVVGVRAFSPHKHGKDAGELVGVEPIGVKATTSMDDILALDADCVLMTPAAESITGQLDHDVIKLLESGKNVISIATYHNVSRETWASSKRPSPSRLQEACQKGGTSLLGAGLHPSFMGEQLAVKMASVLPEVSHVRVVEALDFTNAPEDMWGGLNHLGFGTTPGPLDPENKCVRFGDLYYADVADNIGHTLFGAGVGEVRIESDIRGLPSKVDVQAGSTKIEAGTVGVIHIVHRGYLGDQHIFTNEECWWVGDENIFRGDELPFNGFRGGMCYTIEVSGKPANLRSQLEFELTEMNSPLASATALTVLDAIKPLCEAEPGILIDDMEPRLRLDDRIPSP